MASLSPLAPTPGTPAVSDARPVPGMVPMVDAANGKTVAPGIGAEPAKPAPNSRPGKDAPRPAAAHNIAPIIPPAMPRTTGAKPTQLSTKSAPIESDNRQSQPDMAEPPATGAGASDPAQGASHDAQPGDDGARKTQAAMQAGPATDVEPASNAARTAPADATSVRAGDDGARKSQAAVQAGTATNAGPASDAARTALADATSVRAGDDGTRKSQAVGQAGHATDAEPASDAARTASADATSVRAGDDGVRISQGVGQAVPATDVKPASGPAHVAGRDARPSRACSPADSAARLPDAAQTTLIPTARAEDSAGAEPAGGALSAADDPARVPRPDAAAPEPSFLLLAPGEPLVAFGCRAALPAGDITTLEARSAAFFATSEARSGAGLLVGALPYDRAANDHLFQPVTATRGNAPARIPRPPALSDAAHWAITPEPPRAVYETAVARALALLEAGKDGLAKIVLSRSLRLLAPGPIDPAPLLAALRADPAATVFSTPLPGGRRLIGATPELLISRRGRAVFSHPLAGSARRHPDATEDQAIGAELLGSRKNRHEHALTVEAVLDTLAPFCTTLGAPEGTALTATATMWHLGTRIEGQLRDPATPVSALLAAIHPTPAVCGLPRQPADAAIRAFESYDRGFYAGPVGWLDAAGDGDWYIALRCAEISGYEARLYAGAGIVPGSTPEAEAAETSAKFLAMLAAFGICESGQRAEECNA
ncbi:MAG: isochorismate synthase [Paracoccaceae bacterium]